MKLFTFMSYVDKDTDVIIKDKATDLELNLELADNFKASEVIEISATYNTIVVYIDIEDKSILFNKYAKRVVNTWEKMFGNENHYYFDYDSFSWIIDGIDAPDDGYIFSDFNDLISTMETDIKEILFNSALNNDLEWIVECLNDNE